MLLQVRAQRLANGGAGRGWRGHRGCATAATADAFSCRRVGLLLRCNKKTAQGFQKTQQKEKHSMQLINASAQSMLARCSLRCSLRTRVATGQCEAHLEYGIQSIESCGQSGGAGAQLEDPLHPAVQRRLRGLHAPPVGRRVARWRLSMPRCAHSSTRIAAQNEVNTFSCFLLTGHLTVPEPATTSTTHHTTVVDTLE